MDIEALEAKKHKDLDEGIAITDVDPQYYSELNGRVVKEKFSVGDYVRDTREIFRARLLAGQETDDCIRIDQQFVEEQKMLDKIKVTLFIPIKSTNYRNSTTPEYIKYAYYSISNVIAGT